jgi:uncharacterized protein YegL
MAFTVIQQSALEEDTAVLPPPRRQVVILLIDRSGSMDEAVPAADTSGATTKAEAVAAQVRGFVAELHNLLEGARPNYFYLSVIEFNSASELVLPLTDLTALPQRTSKGDVFPDEYELVPRGQTNMTSALERATDVIREAEKLALPATVVLFSDGVHNINDVRSPDNVARSLRNYAYNVSSSRAVVGGPMKLAQVRLFAAALWDTDQAALKRALGQHADDCVRKVTDSSELKHWLVAISSS